MFVFMPLFITANFGARTWSWRASGASRRTLFRTRDSLMAEQRITANKPLPHRSWKRVCSGTTRVVGNPGPKVWRGEKISPQPLPQRHPAQGPPAVPALLEVQHGVQLADSATQGTGVEVLAVDVLRVHEARVPGIAVDG